MTTHDSKPSNVQDDEQHQSFVGHLTELRRRLIICVVSVLVVFLGLVGFAQELYALLAQPVLSALAQSNSLIATELSATLFAPLKLVFYLAVGAAMPILLYQLWAFIAPGLYRHEQTLALPLLVSSTLLFYLGAVFAYTVVLPMVVRFFAMIGPEGVELMPDIYAYLNLVLTLLMAFGLAFEVPVLIVVLVRIGIVQRNQLSQQRGYVIIGCFVVAMLLTPPDVFSQTLLALPMWLLFELGLWISQYCLPKSN